MRNGAVGVLVLAVVACSGGGGRLTKSEFIAKADALCQQARDQRDAAIKRAPVINNAADAAQFALEKIIPIQRQELAGLRGLKPPKGDEAAVAQLIRDAATATDGLEQELKTDPAKAARDDASLYARADIEAKQYGLKVCGSTPTGATQ